MSVKTKVPGIARGKPVIGRRSIVRMMDVLSVLIMSTFSRVAGLSFTGNVTKWVSQRV